MTVNLGWGKHRQPFLFIYYLSSVAIPSYIVTINRIYCDHVDAVVLAKVSPSRSTYHFMVRDVYGEV